MSEFGKEIDELIDVILKREAKMLDLGTMNLEGFLLLKKITEVKNTSQKMILLWGESQELINKRLEIIEAQNNTILKDLSKEKR